jgi:hypothetical protein
MSSGRYIPDEVPDEFWSVIEEAQQDPERLHDIMKRMNRGGIIRFFWNYEEAAAHLIPLFGDSGLSEDGIHELSNWIIAQGKDYYRRIWDHPELISGPMDDPGLMGRTILEYERRFGEDLPMNEGGFV